MTMKEKTIKKQSVSKTRIITFTNLLENGDDLQKYVDICELHGYNFAYILHDDEKENKKHYHFVVKASGPLSSKVWSERFEKQINQIELVRSEPAIVQYLTHKNQDTKILYEYTSIVTNNTAWVERLYANSRQIEDIEILERLYNMKNKNQQIEDIKEMLKSGVTMQRIKTAQQIIYYSTINNKENN